MRDLWLFCERNCCEEPCLIFIGGGGQTCERQQKPCVTQGNGITEMEWWRPLTKEDIEEYNLSVWGMDDPPQGVIIPKERRTGGIDDPDLRPCVCGHKVKIHTIAREYPYRIEYCVSCMGCGRYSGWCDTMEKAKEKWNEMMRDEQIEQDRRNVE